MEFLEVPLFDDDIFKLLVRFAFNFVFLMLIVGCYLKNQSGRLYTFTFILMNVTVFFICFTLKKLDLGLGMALGLFAIFAIIRFRTDAIRSKEMTYLFIVIGIAVINSLSNKKTSYAELVFTNMAIVAISFFFEMLSKANKLEKQNVIYDQLETLKPENREALFADLESRTGLHPVKVKISKIDLGAQTANVTLYYEAD